MSKRKFRKIRHHTKLPSFADRVKGIDSAKKVVKTKLEFKNSEHWEELVDQPHVHGEQCNH